MQQARSNRSVLMLLQLVILVHMYLDKLCGYVPHRGSISLIWRCTALLYVSRATASNE